MDEAKYRFYMSGGRAGRSIAAVELIKRTPGKKLLVRSLAVMDNYIKMGLQPSWELGNDSIIKTGGYE